MDTHRAEGGLCVMSDPTWPPFPLSPLLLDRSLVLSKML